MFLTKITLHGFKSFAQETVLDVSAAMTHADDGSVRYGITAIVGPNGSGKSNIADAVRWVMGEQSMKSLRSKSGDGVIFAGSDTQRRSGSGRVSLHFDNSDGTLGTEYRDVVLTRTVYRDGRSEYTINGARVRRMDVTDLLAHAGLGKGSYSIITQGMTDAMLTATPLERRAIIEDAAGVKPFQIKKARAQSSLRRAETNMERVTTLLQEIEPHLASLKRQARRAERAREIAEELQTAQRTLFFHTATTFFEQQRTLREEQRARRAACDAAQAEVDALSKELSAYAAELETEASGDDTIARQLREARETLDTYRAKRAKIDATITLHIERAERDIAALKERIPVDTQYVRAELTQLLERITVSDDADISTVRAALSTLRTALSALREAVIRGSVDVDVSAEKERIRAEQERAISPLRKQREALDADIARCMKTIADAEQAAATAASEERKRRAEFFAKERVLREKERVLDAARTAYNEINIQCAKNDVREEDLRTAIQTELGTTPEELLKDTSIDTVDDMEALERRVARLRREHERAGAVDPLVIKEYEETKERYEFLRSQHDDLYTAIRDTRAVIAELDAQIDAAFAEAYGFISKEFTRYFRMMFGGGVAKLHRTRITPPTEKTDDVSETEGDGSTSKEHSDGEMIGITISATPPGKKISDLSQLSGGERSLVSLSLLFAVIAHNPPPFVVLDEVEAALDEANARRFGTILDRLSQQTQFLVITHNRETMRHASLLYGVTMNRDGISRLLSVALDEAQRNADSADTDKIS